MNSNLKNRNKRWAYLALCTVVMLFAGVIYAWSILKAPLAEEFGFSSTVLSVNFTLTFCLFCLGGIVNGRIRDRATVRVRLLLAAACILVGFFIASVMRGALMLYLGYGVLAGFGIGIVYSNVVAEMTLWFPDRQGLCSGILMMGFGASAMLLGSTTQHLIDMPTVGWRRTYLLLGVVIAAVTVAAAVLFRSAPPAEPRAAGAAEDENRKLQLPPSKMVRTLSFWSIFLRAICAGCAGSVLINFARELSLTIGASVALATAVVGILSVCNGLGRLLCGLAFDLLGYKKTLWSSNGISLAAILLTIISYTVGSVPLFVTASVLTGISYGTMTTISSAIVADFYGTKYFAQNFSLMNFTLVATSLMVIVCSAFLDLFGGYMPAFLLLLGLLLIGCILTFFIRKPQQK